MTHTQHRRGGEESLKEDYVILTMVAKGHNDKVASEKLKKILDIFYEHDPVNLGDCRTGSLCQKMVFEEIRSRVTDSATHAVFTSMDVVKKVMKDLKEEDFGISIVVSGIFDDVIEGTKDVNLQPNSVGISLGVWGMTDLLPSEDVMEVITMCGHGMVSTKLVDRLVGRIRAGKTTPKRAARELGRACVCGIFNPIRGAEILEKMAKKEQG